jgi:hypothetical protein
MPTPDFRWIRYRVQPRQLRALSALNIAPQEVPDDVAMEMELPDLRDFPTPIDKALVLLHTAAEIEHMLLVQYLYASFSLRNNQELEPETDATRRQHLTRWRGTLLSIAQQEMGHLMTVQNLLLLTKLPLNLEREDMPPRKRLYPFPLHLEPLTQRSLAKYVVAEAPPKAEGIEDIIALATGAAGQIINHVGVLYALLGVVFTAPGELEGNAATHGGWYEIVRDTGLLGYEQQKPEAWHLPDDAFNPGSATQQAGSEWSDEDQGIRVHKVSSRAEALEALRDISVQGEGPGTTMDSHFEMFKAAFRGAEDPLTPPFPAEGDAWRPSRTVPIDPRIPREGEPGPGDITHPRGKLVAQVADVRYALLLGYIEHYLLAAPADRQFLVDHAFDEMRRIARLARDLSKVHQTSDDKGVAAVPFTLPPLDDFHLPPEDRRHWQLHERRLRKAIELDELTGDSNLKSADESALMEVERHLTP